MSWEKKKKTASYSAGSGNEHHGNVGIEAQMLSKPYLAGYMTTHCQSEKYLTTRQVAGLPE